MDNYYNKVIHEANVDCPYCGSHLIVSVNELMKCPACGKAFCLKTNDFDLSKIPPYKPITPIQPITPPIHGLGNDNFPPFKKNIDQRRRTDPDLIDSTLKPDFDILRDSLFGEGSGYGPKTARYRVPAPAAGQGISIWSFIFIVLAIGAVILAGYLLIKWFF